MQTSAAETTAVVHTKKTTWAWTAGTFFGIGLVGKGGGTVASIATVGLWLLLARLPLLSLNLTTATIVAAIAATLIGIPAGSIVAKELGKKDPSQVVIDEVAGQ